MLELHNLHKAYGNGTRPLQVLKGIDLKIEQGKFIAVAGPSGAGKSTLLHILGGLDTATEGKVIFEGQDIAKLDDASLCRIRNERIGFIFQFYHLLSEFTVLENVLMPSLISTEHRVQSTELKERGLKLLEEVGLAARSRYFPNQLSGGEKQRVAIARGLINNPVLLLCDEPTGNLDSKTGDGIISLIKKISLKNQMTVVLVTHNTELARTADKTYYLKDGILGQ